MTHPAVCSNAHLFFPRSTGFKPARMRMTSCRLQSNYYFMADGLGRGQAGRQVRRVTSLWQARLS